MFDRLLPRLGGPESPEDQVACDLGDMEIRVRPDSAGTSVRGFDSASRKASEYDREYRERQSRARRRAPWLPRSITFDLPRPSTLQITSLDPRSPPAQIPPRLAELSPC